MNYQAKFKMILIALSSLLLIISFQNCSGAPSSGSADIQKSKSAQSLETVESFSDIFGANGNGDGYDGKITYSNYDLEMQDCGSQGNGLPGEKTRIEIKKGEAYKTREDCQDISPVKVDFNSLGMVSYNSNFLVHQSKLFQNHLEIGDGTISTILCRGSDEGTVPNSQVFIDVNIYREVSTGELLMDYSSAAYIEDAVFGNTYSFGPAQRGDKMPAYILSEDENSIIYRSDKYGQGFQRIDLKVDKKTMEATFLANGGLSVFAHEKELQLGKCYNHSNE